MNSVTRQAKDIKLDYSMKKSETVISGQIDLKEKYYWSICMHEIKDLIIFIKMTN